MSTSRKRGQGRITRKKGSSKLYVDFCYLGVRIEKSLGHEDTEENRKNAQEWLDRRMKEIREGTFRYEKVFPDASEKERRFFATLEGREYKPEPDRMLVGEYLESWIKSDLNLLPHTTRIDYQSSINPWIRPFFQDLTFNQINRSVVNRFVSELVHPQSDAEKAAGLPPKPFSSKRVKNILSHLRNIWETACDANRWKLPSPFPPPDKKTANRNGGELLAKELKVIDITEKELSGADKWQISPDRLPLRVDEWFKLYEKLGAWYQPIAELMLLTGMIPSEIAGLCDGLITEKYILVRQVISRGRLYKYLKTDARIRDIRITSRIRVLLDILSSRKCDSPFLVTTREGGPMTHTAFGRAWTRALVASGITHRVPYCLRHSFAAWSLCIGVDLNRMVALMGHATKQMIFERYGRYVDGLEQDKSRILELFGRDFLDPER